MIRANLKLAITQIVSHLTEHPETGIGGGLTAFILGAVEMYDVYLKVVQGIGATAGAIVALLTLYLKVIKPLFNRTKRTKK